MHVECPCLRAIPRTTVVGALLLNAAIAHGQATQPATAAAPPGSTQAAARARLDGLPLSRLVDALGADDFQTRDEAMRQIISKGQDVAAALRERAEAERDLEIRHRIAFILEAILPPSQAVMVIRAVDDCGLRPGDLITHVNSNRVRDLAQLRKLQRGDHDSSIASGGQSIRIIGVDGPRELGEFPLENVITCANYQSPRGEQIAQIVRLYAGGMAEEACARLAKLPALVAEEELSTPLRACILAAGGEGKAALELVRNHETIVDTPGPQQSLVGPSQFDLSGPFKAPLQLEESLWRERATSPKSNSLNDRDLAIQRVRVPANRFVEALTESASIWHKDLRHQIGRAPLGGSPTPGNMLAVLGWMLSELSLQSECVRLIEPRSALLGKTWVRVEIRGWQAFFAGRTTDALDEVFASCREVLQHDDERYPAIIRNPDVAARIAIFLYQAPDDPRVKEILDIVSDHRPGGPPGHRAIAAYAHWMLMALSERNAAVVSQHLKTLLAACPPEQVVPLARGAAILAYVTTPARDEAFAEAIKALQAAATALPGDEEATLWLNLCQAMRGLSADRPAEAERLLRPLAERAEARQLLSTAEFRLHPPAEKRDELAAALLAVPLGRDGKQWLVITRQRKLVRFNAATGRVDAVEAPSATWFPGPLNWPWIGREESSGRVWVYDRRRVLEIGREAGSGLKLNISADAIANFDRDVAPVFSALDALVARNPLTAGENSEFLREELTTNAEFAADPDLPEIGTIRAVTADERYVICGLRGGPSLLIDARQRRAWASNWFAEKCGIAEPVTIFARAAAGRASPLLLLITDQGLIWFEPETETVRRIAIPGEAPFPPLTPESVPYERRDPRWVYCARLPEDGGQVYRVATADGAVEKVDLINVCLPEEFYALRTRGQLREQIDRELEQGGVPPLAEVIETARKTVLGAEKDKAP